MNKHLLETRLRSIKHYKEELNKLNEALKITEQTREDLLKSLEEFFPWYPGDVLMRSETVFKLVKLNDVREYGDINFSVTMRYADGEHGGYGKEKNACFSMEDIFEWKKLN